MHRTGVPADHNPIFFFILFASFRLNSENTFIFILTSYTYKNIYDAHMQNKTDTFKNTAAPQRA